MYLAIEGDKMYVILREVYDGMSAVSVFDIDADGQQEYVYILPGVMLAVPIK